MKKLHLISLVLLATVFGCGKDTFYDKFVPEIMYYQNADVENADFKETVLAKGVTQWTVKSRVSAPMALKEIQVFKITGNQNEELLQTYSDFQLTPNVYKVVYPLTGITSQTTIKIVATDQKSKTSTKNFTIKITP